MFMFASALPEWLMSKMGKIHIGRPMYVKTRKELLATVKPHQRQYLRADCGDLPDMPANTPPSRSQRPYISLVPSPAA
jgi:hypothetical protein